MLDNMTERESQWSYGIAIAIVLVAMVIFALTSCASSQKTPDHIDPVVCPDYFKPILDACDKAYTELFDESQMYQAALETCNRTFNKNLSKSR